MAANKHKYKLLQMWQNTNRMSIGTIDILSTNTNTKY